MTSEKEEKVVDTPKKQTTTKKTTEPESVYSAAELARNHKVLGTSYEIVDVALKIAGKESATLKEAQKIVDEFKHKEV